MEAMFDYQTPITLHIMPVGSDELAHINAKLELCFSPVISNATHLN